MTNENASAIASPETGLEVVDLQVDAAFLARRSQHRDAASHLEAMQRLARAFVEAPDSILQELVNAAVDLCGADSAGISIEKEDRTDLSYYKWVATAGEYSAFLNAELPRYPSACGICLASGRPQVFRVGQRFFDIMGIEAPLVTDGILLPWEVDETRGTIFVMAHGRTEAFGEEDFRTMSVLANFAAMGIRHQGQQKVLVDQACITAAAEMANDLAHQINNPLQALTNLLYLAEEGEYGEGARALGTQASRDLMRLSRLVRSLLDLPPTPGR
jgi:hypothetical protein